MPQPHVIVIGGPNGAGKSTIVPLVLRDYLAIPDFVNADQIAAGLSAFNPEGAAFEAGCGACGNRRSKLRFAEVLHIDAGAIKT
ncbi:MAG: hypothetical protein V4805_09190, partial [Pseudomonadota bacterium]